MFKQLICHPFHAMNLDMTAITKNILQNHVTADAPSCKCDSRQKLGRSGNMHFHNTLITPHEGMRLKKI